MHRGGGHAFVYPSSLGRLWDFLLFDLLTHQIASHRIVTGYLHHLLSAFTLSQFRAICNAFLFFFSLVDAFLIASFISACFLLLDWTFCTYLLCAFL